jgi:hypothetical protein
MLVANPHGAAVENNSRWIEAFSSFSSSAGWETGRSTRSGQGSGTELLSGNFFSNAMMVATKIALHIREYCYLQRAVYQEFIKCRAITKREKETKGG